MASLGVVRAYADLSKGHCFFPRLPVVGSSNAFANLLPLHRAGDSWDLHKCGDETHSGVLASGSPTVYCNLRAVGRESDPVDCGDEALQHSANVFSG